MFRAPMPANGPAPPRWPSNTSVKKSDKEQREFFKKAFGRIEATPYEFDLVINFDYLKRPAAAAAVVSAAFREKFKNRRI